MGSAAGLEGLQRPGKQTLGSLSWWGMASEGQKKEGGIQVVERKAGGRWEGCESEALCGVDQMELMGSS